MGVPDYYTQNANIIKNRMTDSLLSYYKDFQLVPYYETHVHPQAIDYQIIEFRVFTKHEMDIDFISSVARNAVKECVGQPAPKLKVGCNEEDVVYIAVQFVNPPFLIGEPAAARAHLATAQPASVAKIVLIVMLVNVLALGMLFFALNYGADWEIFSRFFRTA